MPKTNLQTPFDLTPPGVGLPDNAFCDKSKLSELSPTSIVDIGFVRGIYDKQRNASSLILN